MARVKGPLKPCPPDFAEVAATMGRRGLKDRYGVGQEIIARWFREIGGNPRSLLKLKQFAVPDDFTTIAPSMTCIALQRHYGVGERTVKRWLRESGAQTARTYVSSNQRREIPEDFRVQAVTMLRRDLRAHYRVSKVVLNRWLREADLLRKYGKESPAVRPTTYRHHAFDRAKVKRDDMRKNTMYDEAADILRRERFVVYPCGPTGLFAPNGLHWRVGNRVVTPDELLERADRYRRRAA